MTPSDASHRRRGHHTSRVPHRNLGDCRRPKRHGGHARARRRLRPAITPAASINTVEERCGSLTPQKARPGWEDPDESSRRIAESAFGQGSGHVAGCQSGGWDVLRDEELGTNMPGCLRRHA
jgi:hypothetical protein